MVSTLYKIPITESL